jgi:hypothetical protein
MGNLMTKIKKNALCFFLVILLEMTISTGILMGQHHWQDLEKIEQYQLFELEIIHLAKYKDPIRDVELLAEFTHQHGQTLLHFGFWEGDSTWKIRFSPSFPGIWNYRIWFSDFSFKMEGVFGCIDNDKPGKVGKNEFNPFWLGKGGNRKDLFRSFHVGDRFFAANWDDPANPDDGDKRTVFLDWLQEMGYNMISVGSFFTNREVKGRGLGWNTPRPWPLDPLEYRKIEVIMDDLRDRDITVFPFAGIFGLGGDWPVDPEEQQLYIKYLLARLGHYPNLILNIAGPEPAWRKEKGAYKGAMRLVDIRRIGAFIDSVDAHNLIITVHNEKGATQYGDPYIDEPWYDMSTLQGPTTVCRETLYSGLAMNHHRYKPAYAQETLWTGNKYHPEYTTEQLRKNAYTILFSGSILNFADNDGVSSTGFSGNCNTDEAKISHHKIIKDVWDWFETIPFHTMVNRQDLVKQGLCLANEGVEYYVYLDTIGYVELFTDFGYDFKTRWINASDPSDIREGIFISKDTGFNILHSPENGNDWILHVYASRPQVVATGNFPALATDRYGNVHIAYNRDGLKYKKYDVLTGIWSQEQTPGCACENVERSAPNIVVDSKGNPHVFCGRDYAWFDGRGWQTSRPGGTRDTKLVIDGKDNVYLTSRGGNHGGYIGLMKKEPGSSWVAMTDPDLIQKGTNDHHYADMYIDSNDHIHLVHRNGPVVRNTYRRSTDGGKTWPLQENVNDRWDESPHVIADSKGNVYMSTGLGELLVRNPNSGLWTEMGRKVEIRSRMRARLGIDDNDNIYVTAFGGRINTRLKNIWMGENLIEPVTEKPLIGFVSTTGSEDFVYVIWEEGEGHPDKGLHDDAVIVVGRLYPDGRITGIK